MSMWQAPFSWQLVSGDVPPTHVAAGKQNWTLVNGALAAGAYVGTACSAVPVGDGVTLGDAFGDVFGLGEVVATLLDGPPRLPRKMKVPTPSRSRITIAAIAGTSQGGLSVGWSWAGRRGAGGLRAGVATGAIGVGGRVAVAGVGVGAT